MKTKEIDNLKQRLINGEIITFDNEDDCIIKEHDDLRGGEIYLRDDPSHSWANGFHIEFNGAIIHNSKTFKPFEKRLNILFEKWQLKINI